MEAKQQHILVDARLYGPKHTGNGRYTKNLLMAIDKICTKYPHIKFTAFTYPDLVTDAKKDLKNFDVVACDIPHYSIKEQLFLPSFIHQFKPDLVHFTHFNKSIFYFGTSIVTVHDLIKHFFKGKDTTTRSPWLYWPKYLAYRLVTRIVILSSYIIVPSKFWQDYLSQNYPIKDDHIITTHEAVDPKFLSSQESCIENPESYILYTGNLYPHKNIKIIFQALTKLPDLKLKIICARSDVFLQRIQKLVHQLKLESQVEFLGYVPDDQFEKLYSHALALVHPSYMEGFSLTGLEAMALNCPVISSTSSCLPEIYQDSVLYFDPDNSTELVDQINKLNNNPKLRQQLIKKGHQQVQKYSWDKTAKLTFDYYLKVLSSN